MGGELESCERCPWSRLGGWKEAVTMREGAADRERVGGWLRVSPSSHGLGSQARGVQSAPPHGDPLYRPGPPSCWAPVHQACPSWTQEEGRLFCPKANQEKTQGWEGCVLASESTCLWEEFDTGLCCTLGGCIGDVQEQLFTWYLGRGLGHQGYWQVWILVGGPGWPQVAFGRRALPGDLPALSGVVWRTPGARRGLNEEKAPGQGAGVKAGAEPSAPAPQPAFSPCPR